MKGITKGALALVAALSAPMLVHAQAKPVVAVLYFDNNSIGKDRADFEGVGKGIADLLINDMASNPNVKVVERDRIQALLTEQNLTKQGSVDPQTAIKLGKLIGAQYMITGGFLSNGKGTYVMTSRAINVETGAITNPVKLTSTGEDVLGMIAELSTKLNNDMKLPALRVGDAGGMDHGKMGEPKMGEAKPAAMPADKPGEAKPMMPPATKMAEAPAKAPQKSAAKPAPVKMDMRSAMLYSKALEAEDAHNPKQAAELFRQVVSKFPTFGPAKEHLAKNGG